MIYKLYVQHMKNGEWVFVFQTVDLDCELLNDLIKADLRLGFNIKIEVAE